MPYIWGLGSRLNKGLIRLLLSMDRESSLWFKEVQTRLKDMKWEDPLTTNIIVSIFRLYSGYYRQTIKRHSVIFSWKNLHKFRHIQGLFFGNSIMPQIQSEGYNYVSLIICSLVSRILLITTWKSTVILPTFGPHFLRTLLEMSFC